MRILFLTTLMPGARQTGSEVASQAFVDGLRAAGHTVTVMGYRRSGATPPSSAEDRVVADRHIETHGAGLRPALWMARAIVRRQPYSAAKYVTRAYARAVAECLEHGRPQLVVVDHAQMAWLLPRDGWSVPHVYLAHNVEHRLYRQLAEAGGRRSALEAREVDHIRRHEERLCATARAVWALSADDASALEELGAHGRARTFDLPPAGTPGEPVPATCDVALLGSWTWKPNAAGLTWFLDAVRPRLPERLSVEVGGAAADRVVGQRAGVTVRGRVPDALSFLRRARAIAVPSVAGAGVQVKTLDAISTGRRVVATPTAMRGITDAPASVHVAGDAPGFATALQAAVTGAPDEASAAAGAWVHARRRAFGGQLAGAVDELDGGRP